MVSFADIFGQDHAVAFLRAALSSGRLPHGMIFAGKTGVGKATTAAALAAAFLCHNPGPSLDPCGRCPSCCGMKAGAHPDYHLVTKELIRTYGSNDKSKAISMTIDVIRTALLEPAGLTAMLNHGKVFIVEQAETMGAPAQNALLKTLEEPPGKTLIILLSDQPESLLPTIRSRTQVVRFANLERSLVEKELTRRGFDAKRATLAAGLADGSLGLAIQWLNDGVADSALELIRRMDRILTGGASAQDAAEDLPNWLKSAAEDYAKRQLAADPLSSKDQHTRTALSIYLRITARRVAQALTATQDGLRQSTLCDVIEALSRAEQYLDMNINTALLLQQVANVLQRSLAA